MDKITFDDVLTHYHLKLKEAYDEVEILKKKIIKSIASIDDGWKGPAADACRFKLDTVNSELTKTQSILSEALTKLSVIGEEKAEEIITTI